MFINCSNHPSIQWEESQKKAAEIYGKIEDTPFPNVNPEDDEMKICEMAEQLAIQILKKHPDAVMCQGEFTLTYAVVNLLIQKGINVISACSAREISEKVDDTGKRIQLSSFKFIRFRRFEMCK